jgi:hypothetical protein
MGCEAMNEDQVSRLEVEMEHIMARLDRIIQLMEEKERGGT